MKTLKQTRSELQREMSMRIRVYQKVPGSNPIKFVKPKEQYQYEVLQNLEWVLSTLNEKNWQAMIKRADEVETERKAEQMTLFKGSFVKEN